MECELNGKNIYDIQSFLKELTRVVSAIKGQKVDFGWELHSLNDRLHGGYGAMPPFDIVVTDAEGMIESMDQKGLVTYCDWMLDIIKSGGKGMAQPEDKEWFEDTRKKALQGEGAELLDFLFDVIRCSPAELTLISGSNAVLRTTKE